MPTEITWKYKWIFWALVFLFLGVLSSPTIVALYHIIIFIPMFVLWKVGPRFKLPKSAWMLLGLTGWGLICTLVNYSELVKAHKSFGELKYYLFGVLLVIPLKHFFELSKPKKTRTLLNIFWVVLIIAFFVGISRSWFQFDPVKMKVSDKYTPYRSGGFLNYMRYGYASAFIVLLGLSAFFNRAKLKEYLYFPLFYSAWILSFAAIFASKTRGALLALMVGVPFVLYRYKPKVAIGIVAAGFLLVSVILFKSFNGGSSSRFFNINDHSNQVRMSQWYTAIKATTDNPVFGVGADQFSYKVPELKKKHGIWADYYAGHSHNIILEHFASYGILGGILIILFLVFWFIEMLKLKTALGWAIASYIVSFTVSGQVELLFDNANSHILFFLYSFSQIHVLSKQKLP